jgi:sulfate-transporting ATPase
MEALQLFLTGLAFTAVLVILGEGIVVIHRGSGVTNFAAAAIGVVGAYACYDVWPGHGIPSPIAIVLGMAASSAIGVAMHLLVMRPLRNASIVTKVIATLGLMILILALSDQYLAPQGLVRVAPSMLPTRLLTLTGNVSVSITTLVLVAVAVVVTVLLFTVQRNTRFGLATTAMSENETVAAGMGWSPDAIATANWAIGSALSALCLILLAPVSGLSPDSLTFLVVPALGAALVGGFDSLLLTVAGAVIIGIGESEIGLITTAPGWTEAGPFIVIVAILVMRRSRRYDRSDVAARLPLAGSGQIGAGMVIATALGTALFLLAGVTWLTALSTWAIMAIGMLSVVVLTGYAGQLSLAQFGLAGASAFITALLAARFGVPLWASLPAAIVGTVLVGLVVAIPAFRTRGPTLAIATLSMVVVLEDLVLTNPTTNGWMSEDPLPPLSIFGISLSPVTGPRSFAIFVLVLALLLTVAVAHLRRGAMGRRMLAIRSNPQAAASLGISPARTQVYAFAIAAILAAVCGWLFESQQPYPGFGMFSTQASITMILQTTVGGVGFLAGPFVGAAGAPGGVFAQALSLFITPSNWVAVITGAVLLLTLLQAPDGIVPVQARQLRACARWVAQRIRRARAAGAGTAGAAAGTRRSRLASTLLTAQARSGRRHPAELNVTGLTVTYGSVKAVDDVTLSVRPGEIVGLIGPNGAGKSTFIDAVCGAAGASAGQVRLGGTQLQRRSAAYRAQQGLTRSFQSLELFEDMTVAENLLSACERPGWPQLAGDVFWPRRPVLSEAARLAVQDFGLTDLLGVVPRQLDHGKRRLLAIARAFATDAAVILLDEPAAGLDATERAELGRLLRSAASEWNLGVLLVEHDVGMVFEICDRVIALVGGRKLVEGAPSDVRNNHELISAYLGSGDDVEADRTPETSI